MVNPPPDWKDQSRASRENNKKPFLRFLFLSFCVCVCGFASDLFCFTIFILKRRGSKTRTATTISGKCFILSLPHFFLSLYAGAFDVVTSHRISLFEVEEGEEDRSKP